MTASEESPTRGFASAGRPPVVVVTGASAGVGRAVVRRFAAHGASLGLIARGRDGLEAARAEVERCGARACVLPLDVADADAVEAAAAEIEVQLGPIDIWINNAMVSVFSPVARMTAAEFRRVTEVNYLGSPTVRCQDTEFWCHLLNGLWLSGLSLMESLVLSWGDESPFAVDLSGRRPRFRIYGEAEKGGEDRYLPMAPDFAEQLLLTAPKLRFGFVFPLTGDCRQQFGVATVGRIVSEIGEKAGVIVNAGKEKYASAHDLRRSFGTRWTARVKPAILQLLMRHESVETTMKYYVDQDADDVSDQLWEQHNQQRSNVVPKPPDDAAAPNASTDSMQ